MKQKNCRFPHSCTSLIRFEIGTTNEFQCLVPVWRDHTIGPEKGPKKRTADNGDNHCTRWPSASFRGRVPMATWKLLPQWMKLRNRIKDGSSWYSHYPSYVISPAVAGCNSRSCTDRRTICPFDLFGTRFSSFFKSPGFEVLPLISLSTTFYSL